MNTHHHHTDGEHRTDERVCDVAVIGGSAAGLAAALQLGRQRRHVIVVDAGEPRNAPAAHVHSYLGHEGLPPSQLIAIGREEVRSYGVEVIAGRAVCTSRSDDGRFRVELDGGHAITARRLVAATGVVDVLPDIDGVARNWGAGVIHCPFCHGYEVRDRRIVQIVTVAAGLHPAPLFRQLTDRLTVVLHGGVDVDDGALAPLLASGVEVVAGVVTRIADDGAGSVTAVEMDDGTLFPADAVAVGTGFRANAGPFEPLGLRPASHPVWPGDFVETDGSGETSVPGLYAAGNLADPSLQVLPSAAAGSRVGAMVSFSLADEDLAAGPSSPAADEWDARYSGERMWSGNPNGTLVVEVATMAPGRALDIGAGEGGDALWLAERGWQVTASDISRRGLDQIAGLAADRGLAIDCLLADVAAPAPFEPEGYDLVSALYVPIPRSPDDRGIHNLLSAVAVGGTLLVVSHDPDALRSAPGGHRALRDPDATVLVDSIASVVSALPGWEIEGLDKRERPSGHSTIPVDDVVLRARRIR